MSFFIKLRIKTQFNLYFTIFSLLIIISTSYFYVNKYKHDIHSMFDKYGSNILENISPLILSNLILEDYFRIQETIKKVAKNNEDIERIVVVDNENIIISDTEITNLSKKFSWTPHEKFSLYAHDLKVNNVQYGYIYLVLNKTTISNEINNLYANVVIAILVFFILSLLLGDQIAKYFSKPLNKFLDSIEMFKNKKIAPSSESIIAPKEISILYVNFYEMIKTIQDRELKLESTLNELKNMKEFIQKILDSIPTGILTIDSGFKATFCNKKFYEMFNFNKSIIGENITDLFSSSDINDILSLIKNSKEGNFRRYQIKSKPKNFYDISIFRIDTDSGTNMGILIEDVTEDVEKDNLIFHAQKMDALGILAGGIAHDINNVLAAMKNSLTVISMMECPEEMKPMLGILEKSIYRASNIVKQILSFSRKQDIQYQKLKLSKLIDDVVNILRNTADKSIEIETIIENDNLEILGDENQIEQAILNICINSCHAMTLMRSDGKKGGKLSIRLTESNPKFLGLSELSNKSYAMISISDTGVGIPKDIIPKIFDPFFTTKKSGEGTGLGLSIVHRIIKEHNGGISVYSEECFGTTMNIFLPIEVGSETKMDENDITNIRYSLTAFVVDDDKLVLESNCTLLRSVGIDVIPLDDPIKAIDTYQSNKDKIDICILDIMMPKVSGLELAKQILNISPSQKIILTSGFFNDANVDSFINENKLAFLPKPFSIKQLKECLNTLGIKPQ